VNVTDTPNNPPSTSEQTPTEPAPTDRRLKTLRLLIAVGLFGGVLVFGVFAFETLLNPPANNPRPDSFGKSDGPPMAQPAEQDAGDALRAMARPDPSKFIPIRRDNPHPGEIRPFLGAEHHGMAPYQQPVSQGEVWEVCHYQTTELHTPEDAFDYYHRQAEQRGLDLRRKAPIEKDTRGGLQASWGDGQRTLDLIVWHTQGQALETRPPLKPRGPLDWVVKYSYPRDAR